MTERVSVTVGGYELEYSREPLLELFRRAAEPWPNKGLGGTGWSGRMHAWALVPTGSTARDPEGWLLTATEPETGMLGTVAFNPAGDVVGITVGDFEPLFYGTPLKGLLSGWANALGGAPGGAISSQGQVRARCLGGKWEESFIRVGESECGHSGDTSF